MNSLLNIREQFPILNQSVQGHTLVYLDNAATTQKPWCVLNKEREFYCEHNSNVHRGVHTLSARATALYEASRESVREFIHAASTQEIIFTKGTTEAINLVAQSYLRPLLKAGDEVLLSAMEHHSNIVPWQLVCEATGAVIKVIPMDLQGELDLSTLDDLINVRTRLVAVTHVSNALGTVNDIATIIQKAHEKNVPVLIDGAQAVPHRAVDVQALQCDFYAFSSHKLYGPTGVGVLYAKKELLKKMPPYQGGGDMIKTVSFTKTVYQDLPYKFEAGTPNIAGVIGLGSAIEFIKNIGFTAIEQHEKTLMQCATEALKNFPGIHFIGEAAEKSAVISFMLDDVHPHDVGTILDQHGVAVRTGHHCSMPVMEFFDVPATVRVSFAMYNTLAEIDCLLESLSYVKKVFA